MSEYKSTSTKVKFVPLSSPKTVDLITADETKLIENTILIEVGSCKSHLPEKMAWALLLEAMEVNTTDV